MRETAFSAGSFCNEAGCEGTAHEAGGPRFEKATYEEVQKTLPFLRHFLPKTIILPSQAQDKHRETSKKRHAFFAGRVETNPGQHVHIQRSAQQDDRCAGKKTGRFAPFYAKMIILPRQARDKHRESSKRHAFSDRDSATVLARSSMKPTLPCQRSQCLQASAARVTQCVVRTAEMAARSRLSTATANRARRTPPTALRILLARWYLL